MGHVVRDEVTPDGRWRFDGDVTAVFDDMLERSIPQHDVMRAAVAAVAGRHMQTDSMVLDLGTSRGQAIARLNPSQHDHCRFVGVEVSPAMLAAARDRFDGLGNVTILDHDLRRGLPAAAYGGRLHVAMAVLTLMFVPIEHRARLVHQVRCAMPDDGVFVVVEKVLGATARIDEVLVDLYLDLKASNGYTPDQIDRKRASLEGVLVPVTDAWNRDMLHRAGFTQVDSFWRWMNFAGYIARP